METMARPMWSVMAAVLLAAALAMAAPAWCARVGDLPVWLDGEKLIYQKVVDQDGTYYLLPFEAPKSGQERILVHVHPSQDGKYVSIYASVVKLPASPSAYALRKALEANAGLHLARLAIVDGDLDFVHECPMRLLDREHFLAMIHDVAQFCDNTYRDLRDLFYDFSAQQPLAGAGRPTGDGVYRAQRSLVQVIAESETGVQRGSGFAIGEGLVLARRHVVDGARRLWVVAPDEGERLLAERVAGPGVDLDACLLRVPALACPPLAVAGQVEGGHRPGEDVWVLGFPDGDPNLTVTRGLPAGFTRREGVRCLKTTALVRRGHSGGPVVDEQGLVVGVLWQSGDDGFHSGVTPARLLRDGLASATNAEERLATEMEVYLLSPYVQTMLSEAGVEQPWGPLTASWTPTEQETLEHPVVRALFTSATVDDLAAAGKKAAQASDWVTAATYHRAALARPHPQDRSWELVRGLVDAYDHLSQQHGEPKLEQQRRLAQQALLALTPASGGLPAQSRAEDGGATDAVHHLWAGRRALAQGEWFAATESAWQALAASPTGIEACHAWRLAADAALALGDAEEARAAISRLLAAIEACSPAEREVCALEAMDARARLEERRLRA